MLSRCDLIGFIPTKNPAQARTFYEQTLGLRFLSNDVFALVMETLLHPRDLPPTTLVGIGLVMAPTACVMAGRLHE